LEAFKARAPYPANTFPAVSGTNRGTINPIVSMLGIIIAAFATPPKCVASEPAMIGKIHAMRRAPFASAEKWQIA
jgi:hypothetical protein